MQDNGYCASSIKDDAFSNSKKVLEGNRKEMKNLIKGKKENEAIQEWCLDITGVSPPPWGKCDSPLRGFSRQALCGEV